VIQAAREAAFPDAAVRSRQALAPDASVLADSAALLPEPLVAAHRVAVSRVAVSQVAELPVVQSVAQSQCFPAPQFPAPQDGQEEPPDAAEHPAQEQSPEQK
jgi:hypothetical protein